MVRGCCLEVGVSVFGAVCDSWGLVDRDAVLLSGMGVFGFLVGGVF